MLVKLRFLLLFFFCLAVLASSSSLQFSLQYSRIQSNKEWTRVLLGIQGGFQPYSFSYTMLPKGWRQVNSYIYIPRRTFQNQGKYPCKVIVRDENHSEINATVFFFTKNSKIFLENEILSYETELSGYDAIEVHDHSSSTLEEQKTQTSLEKTLKKTVETVKQKAQKESEEITQKQSIQSIFSRLPSQKDLDEIIESGDAFAISKTIQLVITSELTCDQKIAYLSDFAGRIKSAIEIKTFALSQLKVVSEGAKTEITRLTEEIKYLKEKIQSLQLSQLQKDLKVQLDVLEQGYNNFNEVQTVIEEQKLLLKQHDHNIYQLKIQASSKRKFLISKKLILTQANAEVSKLQQQLKNAKERQAIVENQVASIIEEIRTIETTIQHFQLKITKTEEQIKELSSRSDSLKRQYTQLEIKVQRIRSDISRNTDKKQITSVMIQQYKQNIQTQEKKLSLKEIELIQNMLTALERNLPNIQQKIDGIYYQCYSEDIHEENIEGELVYTVNGKNLQHYIEKAYQIKTKDLSLQSEITLNRVDIYCQKWRETYGAVYQKDQVQNRKSFQIGHDFNCLNPSSLESGEGIIIGLRGNKIIIERGGQKQQLKVGACSRLEAIDSLPKVGERIYWKGKKEGQSYEVYRASCI